MKNEHEHNSPPSLLTNIELSEFRDKTNQLMAKLESNDISSALKCINEINEITGKNFYSIIGKLTRGLHDAISDLSISSVQGQPEKDLTRVDLNYVIGLTEDAAQKTLDMTERSMVNIRNLSQNNVEQSALLEGYLSTHSPDEEASSLFQSLSSLCKQSDANIAQVNANITEIMMAQNFQDLASQSITKAINIIKEVENSLVALTQYANLLTKLARFSDQAEDEINLKDSEELKSDIGELNNISKNEHLDQNDVDNLLSSLGF